MSTLLPGLRYALRSLRRSPGFTSVAILTLALGIGANTAVFSLINAVLLRPLPYAEPHRLVLIWESAPFFGLHDSPVSPANYADWKIQARSFEEMGALEDRGFRLSGDGAPEVVDGSLATASLLRALRIRPALGRIFRDDEDRPGAAKVALISDSFWRRRFDAKPNLAGLTLTLDDEKYAVVGVLAPGTEPPAEYRSRLADIWAPFGSSYTAQGWANRGRHNWMVVGRLREGVTPAQANSEMQAIGAGLARQYPETNEKVGAFVAPLREHFTASSRRLFLLLLGTVALVLLIACSNLASLLLSRAANRGKEVAVRASLGASRPQLLRQFLWESLLLCLAGSALGLLLASFTFEFLAHLAPGAMTGAGRLEIDWRVLGFSLVIAVVTALVFSLVPLMQVRRLDLTHALKQNARTLAAAGGSRRVRALLISAEVALAFVLLIAAGLLLQTFARVRGVDPGFRTRDLLTLTLRPAKKIAGQAKIAAWQQEILRRVAAIPGVVSAGFTNHIPIASKGDINGIGAEGHDDKTRFHCNFRMAGPGYFRTMGIPLRRGRDLDERDADGAPPVIVLNETLARTIWPGSDPIGRRIHFGGDAWATVVGVVADIHQSGLDVPPKPEYYISTLQAPYPASSLAIRTQADPLSLVPAVRQAIWSFDPDQPITELASMEEILDREVFERRVQTTLLTAFAGLALLLAAIGLYGLLAYLVSQRIPEIGLRLALGATTRDIVRTVVGFGLRLALAGIVAGAFAAFAVSRVIASFLFHTEPLDPATYLGVAGVLLLTAAIASYLPARRATRVDPVIALREE